MKNNTGITNAEMKLSNPKKISIITYFILYNKCLLVLVNHAHYLGIDVLKDIHLPNLLKGIPEREEANYLGCLGRECGVDAVLNVHIVYLLFVGY